MFCSVNERVAPDTNTAKSEISVQYNVLYFIIKLAFFQCVFNMYVRKNSESQSTLLLCLHFTEPPCKVRDQQ